MTVAVARDLAPTASPAHDRRLSRAGRLFRQASSSPAPSRSISSPASEDGQSRGTERTRLREKTHLSVAFAQSIAASQVSLSRYRCFALDAGYLLRAPRVRISLPVLRSR